MEKIVGFLVFVCLLVMAIYFLNEGKLGAASFVTLVIALIIGELAFYGFDRLKELDLLKGRLTLERTVKEIEKAKENVIETEKIITHIAIKQLGDMAMWHNVYGGDRRSYSKLLDWKHASKDSLMTQWLNTEIDRIKDSYRLNIIVGHVENWNVICKPHAIPPCSNGFENVHGFSAQNVLDHISQDNRWDERARAVCLLRNIKTAKGKESISKEKLFEKLIKHMNLEIENSLCVAVLALNTYKELSGFNSKEVFDFEGAINDWEKRKEEILKKEF